MKVADPKGSAHPARIEQDILGVPTLVLTNRGAGEKVLGIKEISGWSVFEASGRDLMELVRGRYMELLKTPGPQRDRPFIADYVRMVRSEMGMTQEQFATRLGVAWSSVALWESGKTVPRLGHLRSVVETEEGRR